MKRSNPFVGSDPIDGAELQRQMAAHEAYRAEHGTWNAVATSIREERDELDEDLRDQAIAALGVLRQELDETWPFRFFGSDARAASFIGNNAAWTSKMLVILAREIEVVKTAPGWATVREGLMEPESADPALLQVEMGHRALSSGMALSFEPPGRKAKRADLRISSGTTAINVECTSIQAIPDASEEASRVSWALCPMIRIADLGLHVGGWAAGLFAEDELKELAAQAIEFYQRCSSENRQDEFQIPGTLFLWATPINHPDAQAFIESHGGKITFSVGFQHDPLQRLMATIDRKARGGQLLQEEPGLIVIEPSRLITQVHVTTIRTGVRRAVLPYSYVNAVALVHRFLGRGPDALVDLTQGDYANIGTLYRPIQEDIVVVRNPNRVHAGADQLIDQLFRKSPPQNHAA